MVFFGVIQSLLSGENARAPMSTDVSSLGLDPGYTTCMRADLSRAQSLAPEL